jgi:hypothetical protein
MRTEAYRQGPLRNLIPNLDRSAQDSMGGAGGSPATFGDSLNESPSSVPQSLSRRSLAKADALRIPHSDIPIQLSKTLLCALLKIRKSQIKNSWASSRPLSPSAKTIHHIFPLSNAEAKPGVI